MAQPLNITPDARLELATLGDMLHVHRTRCHDCRDARALVAEIDTLLDQVLEESRH